MSHATGAVPINLNEANADFAVGCTYKYLNSGPGGPSFLWINKRHQNRVLQPITGWYSYESPFNGISQFLTGCPHIIQTAVVDCSIDIFLETDMDAIREKSLFLSDLFIELLDKRCPQLNLVTPRNHEKRASHVAYLYENGLAVSKYLRQHKLMCDFRHPDIIRFAMTPLYLRFVDIWDAVDLIYDAIKNAEHETINEIIGIS